MQKTITLKDFKVFVLKTVLAILVLGISSQVSFAQSLSERQKGSKGSLINKATFTPPVLVKKQAMNEQQKAQMKKELQNTPQVQQQTSAVGTATDVPALNQKIATTHALFSSVSANPHIVAPSIIPSPNGVQDVCTFNGSLGAGSLTESVRFFRDGVAAACGSAKACNGSTGAGPYYYNTYTMQNLTCASQCVTVQYIANAGGGDCFVAAYSGSFNVNNLCQNYLADGGSSSLSGGTAVSFGFTLAANQTVVLVINEAVANTSCPSYTMTVTGITCTPPPPCQPATSSILSQAGGIPQTVNLINETFNSVLPAGWAQQNLSSPLGVTNWFQGNTGVFPANSGTGYIAANYQNGSGLATLSNWLFAPNVNLKNGDVFKFYTRTTSGVFPDRLQVRLSTNGASVNVGASATSVGDFSTLLLDINPTYTASGYPTAWTQYSLTMSGLPAGGVSGRLAFRYFVENGGPSGANSDYIGIDDVLYSTFQPGPVTTCTGSTANLQVAITGGPATATYNVTIHPTVGSDFTVTNYTSGNMIPVTPAVTTTYNLVSVIQSDNPCCIGTGLAGTPTITVLPATISPIAITASPDAPLCAGNPTLLDVVSGIPLTNYILSQSTSTTVTTGNSVACNSGGLTTDNSYWRIYDLSTYPLNGPFTIKSVRFGVELANLGPQNITVNLYSQTGAAFPAGTRTLIGTQTYSLPNQNNTLFTATLTTPIVVANNSKIVIELFSPGQGKQFWIGSNSSAQTGTTYLSAAPCGITTPTDIAAIGFPNMHIILDLGGSTGGASGPLPPNWTVFWTPASGLSSTTTHPVAASPMQTTTYTVVATDPGTGCMTSAAKTIIVNQLPAITSNPANLTVCNGTTATFTSVGTGAGATFQWQVSTNAGVTWTNLTNAAPYSGVTTGTLTINPVALAMNGNRYRMVVSGICAPSANSTGAILTVNALPAVTINPANQTCGGIAGTNGTQLTASGAASYVWTPNGAGSGLYTDAAATLTYTGTNLATVYAAPSNTTTYTVTGTAAGTGCTNTAQIIVVYTPAAPVVNPTSVTMCLGDPAAQIQITSSLQPSPFTTTYSTGPISVGIPDNNPVGVISTLAVPLPSTANITSMYITLNMTHTWDGDIVYALKAPNGKILNLDYYLSSTGGAGPTTGFTNTIISSTGTVALSSGVNPYSATFKPDAMLTTPFGPNAPTIAGYGTANVGNFAGLYSTPNGNWILGAYDGGAGDVGTITSWSLTFNYLYGPPASGVWSPAFGLYNDAAATSAYVAGTSQNTVFAQPTPGGLYNYAVTVTSIGPNALTTFSNPTNLLVPCTGTVGPACPYPDIINVSGLATSGVTVNSVTLTGISHTWESDMGYVLQSPSGQNVILMNAINGTENGGFGILNKTYTFSDAAATGLNLGGPTNPSGTYKCSNNSTFTNWPAPGPGTVVQGTNPTLATFTGNMNGAWKLYAVDVAGGDFGNVSGGYSITFSAPTVGCTSAPTIVPVTVNTPISITTQPVNAVVCTDKTTTFSVVVTGTSPTYRWQVSTDAGNTFTNLTNTPPYSGVTTATLTITAPPVSLNGNIYRCAITGAAPCGTVNTLNRTLTVNPLPTIVITPAPYSSMLPGLRTSISSTVSPIAATYTWLRNGAALTGTSLGIVSGVGTGTLVVDVDAMGSYQLRVTDINGCTNISNTVVISDSTSGRVWIYPNPNAGQFQVRYNPTHNNVIPRGINVYNSRGQRILSQQYTLGLPFARMNVDLTNHGSGVYWIEVVDVDGNRLAVGRAEVLR